MKKFNKAVTNKNGTGRAQFSYTLEVLPQILFPGHDSDVKIHAINVDYSRNIINFHATGVPGVPPTPEGSESYSVAYEQGHFTFAGGKK
jgi:hypothetical protein